MTGKLLPLLLLPVALGVMYLTVQRIQNPDPVQENSQAATTLPATLNDFWNGTARFTHSSQHKFPVGAGNSWVAHSVGMDVVTKGSTWYLFHRQIIPNWNSACAGGVGFEIVMRKSTDKGKTWGAPLSIVRPNQPYNNCYNTDGDAYFEASTNTWHYIWQCLQSGTGQLWNMCHATFVGSEPTGLFTMNGNNPVVRSGEIWSKIKSGVREEGTPEIISYADGWFYVTFHGYDGVNGYRGAARTQNFDTWEVVNTGLIFSKTDCVSWNVPWHSSGCIGGGAATVLREEPYHYMVIEAADINLGCSEDQHWVSGILRSTFLSAPVWEHPSFKPVIVDGTPQLQNGKILACASQYAKLFKDTDGTIYFMIWRASPVPDIDNDPMSAIYIYKLEHGVPIVDYQFHDGPGHQFVFSSTVGGTPSFAELKNVSWNQVLDSPVLGGDQYHIDFTNTNSHIVLPNNPLLYNQNEIVMSLNAKINSAPSAGSTFIAGIPLMYSLELYPDGNLCALVYDETNVSHSACKNVTSFFGSLHSYELRFTGNTLYLAIDGTIGSQKYIGKRLIQRLDMRGRIGSATTFQSGELFKTFSGSVARFSIGERSLTPLQTPPQPPTATPTSTPTRMPTSTPTLTPTKAPPVGSFSLVSPADDAIIPGTTNVRFQWTIAPNVTNHKFTLFDTAAGTYLMNNSGITPNYCGSDLCYTKSGLTIGKNYQWYVSACNSNNVCTTNNASSGSTSPWHSFTLTVLPSATPTSLPTNTPTPFPTWTPTPTPTTVPLQACGVNIAVNPSFESGNTGFVSGFTHSTSQLLFYTGYYRVDSTLYTSTTSTPNIGYGDGGKALILTVPVTAPRVAWSQTFAVNPNTTYTIKYYATLSTDIGGLSGHYTGLNINGQALSDKPVTTAFPSYSAFEYTWNSGSNTSANVQLTVTEQVQGKVYFIDTISIVGACPPTATPTRTPTPIPPTNTPTRTPTPTNTPTRIPTPVPCKAGDCDCNGSVNLQDLSSLLSNYGKTGMTRAQGNVDGDQAGIINSFDMTIILANFGK